MEKETDFFRGVMIALLISTLIIQSCLISMAHQTINDLATRIETTEAWTQEVIFYHKKMLKVYNKYLSGIYKLHDRSKKR